MHCSPHPFVVPSVHSLSFPLWIIYSVKELTMQQIALDGILFEQPAFLPNYVPTWVRLYQLWTHILAWRVWTTIVFNDEDRWQDGAIIVTKQWKPVFYLKNTEFPVFALHTGQRVLRAVEISVSWRLVCFSKSVILLAGACFKGQFTC